MGHVGHKVLAHSEQSIQLSDVADQNDDAATVNLEAACLQRPFSVEG